MLRGCSSWSALTLHAVLALSDSTFEVEILRTAIHAGINFIDNAEVYGAFPGESEYIMGQAAAFEMGMGS